MAIDGDNVVVEVARRMISSDSFICLTTYMWSYPA